VQGYAASREGLDKAGAYAAQGLGAFPRGVVAGSYTNVVGLPCARLVSDLQALGLLEGFPAASFRTGCTLLTAPGPRGDNLVYGAN
jgi:septum formation protein